MKVFFFASALSIVGSCATKSYTEKIQDIKDHIVFDQPELVNNYASTITEEELKSHVYELSSKDFEGRKTGELGHNKASQLIKNYYLDQHIPSPLGASNYYQNIPKSYFTNGIKSSQNVLAYIEGTEFPNEIIIISAHLDHLGIENGLINYGADDNGSGTSAIMEIAQAFKKAKDEGYGPKRSFLFLHVTGEEEGLVGSRYYTEHPIFPLEHTITNLNIDMIGRVDKAHETNPNYIYIIGADRLSTELHYISEASNTNFSKLQLDYKFNSDNDVHRYYYRSDHYNFAEKDIPVIFYFSGEHEDYHKPTDTPEKINYSLLTQRTKLIFYTAWYLANSESPIIADKIE
jgi:hypothetical protein